jgi:tetratricopeptide (TPR) repeat protein
MKTRNRLCLRLAVLALAASAASPSLADQLIMKNGQVMEAKSIRYRVSSQEYIVITPDNTTVPVKAALVERAVTPKPANLDALAAGILSKPEAAIAPLEAIINENAGLDWDNVARDLLGQALVAKKDAKKAVSVYKDIFDNMAPERVPLQWRRHYWDALKNAEMFAVLKADLDKVIAAGSRDTAALAQLMRGDMYKAQGQKTEALYDYLRTVVLYEKTAELQPEAIFKSAELLEELRDPRAAEMKKKLIQEYGSSPYAKKAAGG